MFKKLRRLNKNRSAFANLNGDHKYKIWFFYILLLIFLLFLDKFCFRDCLIVEFLWELDRIEFELGIGIDQYLELEVNAVISHLLLEYFTDYFLLKFQVPFYQVGCDAKPLLQVFFWIQKWLIRILHQILDWGQTLDQLGEHFVNYSCWSLFE